MLTMMIGVAYPAFMSFKALETPNKADDRIWLIYWVFFSFLSTVEVMFGGEIPLGLVWHAS